MTSVFPARRRAEEFDALVDSGGAPGHDTRYSDLLDVVAEMRALEGPTPRPEFVATLREQLMAEADVALSRLDAELTLPARSRARTRREKRLAVTAGAIALVGAGSSMAVAAQAALPGDTLYPIKRAIEDTQARFNTNDGAKAEDLLANASSRLDEVAALSRRGTAEGDAQVPETLQAFNEQAEKAADLMLKDYRKSKNPERIADLRNFTGASVDTLGLLDAVVPEGARDALDESAERLVAIDDRAAEACATCGGSGIGKIPQVLLTATAVDLPDVLSDAPSIDAKDEPSAKPPKDDDKTPDAAAPVDPPPSSAQPPADRNADDPPPAAGGKPPKNPVRDLTGDLIDTLTGGTKSPGGNGGNTGGGTGESDPVTDLVGGLTDPLLGEGGLLNP